MKPSTPRLPPLPAIGDIIRLFGLSAKQHLSQNFLLDLNLTNKIANTAKNLNKSVVLEVGAGPGSLTRSLIQNGAKHLIAIEKDSRFLSALQGLQQAVPERLQIVHGDVLEIDEGKLVSPFHSEKGNDIVIIGNLPFNIATVLLLKWLKMISQRQHPFVEGNNVSMILLFQSEVGKRIAAAPGSSEFNRLSVMAQTYCHAQAMFDIPGKAFVPPPKVQYNFLATNMQVNATLVKLEPRSVLASPSECEYHIINCDKLVSFESLEHVCKIIFAQKRKIMQNCAMFVKTFLHTETFRGLGPKSQQILQNADINANLRPHQLTIEEINKLAFCWQQLQNT